MLIRSRRNYWWPKVTKRAKCSVWRSTRGAAEGMPTVDSTPLYRQPWPARHASALVCSFVQSCSALERRRSCRPTRTDIEVIQWAEDTKRCRPECKESMTMPASNANRVAAKRSRRAHFRLSIRMSKTENNRSSRDRVVEPECSRARAQTLPEHRPALNRAWIEAPTTPRCSTIAHLQHPTNHSKSQSNKPQDDDLWVNQILF